MQGKKPKASLTIRVELADLGEWTRRANLRGLSISEWIRRRCNEADGADVRTGPLSAIRVDLADLAELGKGSAAVAHDPRCTCLACKPVKKAAKT